MTDGDRPRTVAEWISPRVSTTSNAQKGGPLNVTRTTIAQKNSADRPAGAPDTRANSRHADPEVAVRHVISSVEERLYYAYNKLMIVQHAQMALHDPPEGGVPFDVPAIHAGLEDLVNEVLTDLRAVRAALNSQDAYMPALIADAPEVH
ncbi:MAG: hypothetical protein GEV06_09420 [Luteitalea sp.]|nr:hypothetical protein [Luteitalea sp.]